MKKKKTNNDVQQMLVLKSDIQKLSKQTLAYRLNAMVVTLNDALPPTPQELIEYKSKYNVSDSKSDSNSSSNDRKDMKEVNVGSEEESHVASLPPHHQLLYHKAKGYRLQRQSEELASRLHSTFSLSQSSVLRSVVADHDYQKRQEHSQPSQPKLLGKITLPVNINNNDNTDHVKFKLLLERQDILALHNAFVQ